MCSLCCSAKEKPYSCGALAGTLCTPLQEQGMRFWADITHGLEVFVDVSCAWNWDKKDAQLQTEIALSST